MSDEETRSPIPWNLVEHVRRTSTGKTTLQISLSIETRARLAQASLDLGCSKLALIRTAISQFLLAHEKARSIGQEQAYAAVSGASDPVPGPEPVGASEPTRAVPEPTRTPEPETPPVVDPEQSQAPKRSRAKKGGRS